MCTHRDTPAPHLVGRYRLLRNPQRPGQLNRRQRLEVGLLVWGPVRMPPDTRGHRAARRPSSVERTCCARRSPRTCGKLTAHTDLGGAVYTYAYDAAGVSVSPRPT